MEKVRTGPRLAATISAATVDESMPPDKKAPSGTSEIMLIETAFASRACNLSSASASEPANG